MLSRAIAEVLFSSMFSQRSCLSVLAFDVRCGSQLLEGRLVFYLESVVVYRGVVSLSKVSPSQLLAECFGVWGWISVLVSLITHFPYPQNVSRPHASITFSLEKRQVNKCSLSLSHFHPSNLSSPSISTCFSSPQYDPQPGRSEGQVKKNIRALTSTFSVIPSLLQMFVRPRSWIAVNPETRDWQCKETLL